MKWPPFDFKGCLFNVNLYSKIQIETVLVCTLAKNEHSKPKSRTDSIGTSARFSNYVVCDILMHLKQQRTKTLEHWTIECRFLPYL